MCEFLSSILTQENITLALSIFGSIGTLITFISAFVTKRKNLKLKLNTCVYKTDLQRLVIGITFENRSQLPIAVTSVSLIVNNQESLPLKHPHCVGSYAHREDGEVIDRKFTYNLDFPVDISQLSAVSGQILFEFSPVVLKKLSTPLTLLIHSTRGRVQKILFQPDQIQWF